ncbi:MAG: 30S ribosomal protein S6 [Planctomycetota bacterium]|jgi:small subunit ribosomal protein S6
MKKVENKNERLYEGMFLVDSAIADDSDAVMDTIKNILNRADCQIVSIGKWAERKLAYEINGKSRGTYFLCYFRAGGDRIRDIERDVQLSDKIMRVLILKAEGVEEKDVKQKALTTAVQPVAQPHGVEAVEEEKEEPEGKSKPAPIAEAQVGSNQVEKDESEQSAIGDIESQSADDKQNQAAADEGRDEAAEKA